MSVDPKKPTPPGTQDSVNRQSAQQEVVKFAKETKPNTTIMPTLLGVGYGTYQQRPENFLLSFVSHTGAIALMLWLLHVAVPAKIIPPSSANAVDISPYIPMKVAEGRRGGGGGGDARKLKPPAGPPHKAPTQQSPPPTVLPQKKSKLMIDPTVVADLRPPQNVQIGDPLSKLMTPSNGVGVGGGIG